VNSKDIAKVHQWSIVKGFFPDSNNNPLKEPHYAIVLNEEKDIANDDCALVVGISSSDESKSGHPEDLIPIAGFGLTKQCYVHCDWVRWLRLDVATSTRNGYDVSGPLLAKIKIGVGRATKRKSDRPTQR
jgi:hypothetical protein